jgi:hypothetical protein
VVGKVSKPEKPKFENKIVGDDFLKKWWAAQIKKANQKKGK